DVRLLSTLWQNSSSSSRHLEEMIQEDYLAFKGRLLVSIYFKFNTNISLCYSPQVGCSYYFGNQSYATIDKYRLIKSKLFDAIIDLHLQVSNLDYLVPKIWHQRKGQVSVSNCIAKGRFLNSLFGINMDPLMIKCCVGKEVYLILSDLVVIRHPQLLPCQFF